MRKVKAALILGYLSFVGFIVHDNYSHTTCLYDSQIDRKRITYSETRGAVSTKDKNFLNMKDEKQEIIFIDLKNQHSLLESNWEGDSVDELRVGGRKYDIKENMPELERNAVSNLLSEATQTYRTKRKEIVDYLRENKR